MTQTPAQLAEAIWAARQAGHTLDADATLGSPDLATAYAIQRALLALRLAAGERVVGWKLGYTSEVMRRQMGIDRPNFGPLTDWMLLGSGDAVDERLVQPRVEPEIGLRLKTPLDARHVPVDRHRVAAAVEGAYACLEVVHSTWTGYRFNLEQNTADNSSAGQGGRWAAPARDRPDDARHRGGAPVRWGPHAGPGCGRRRRWPPAGRGGAAGAGTGCEWSATGGG